MRSKGKAYYPSEVLEPPGGVVRLLMGAVESSRSRAPRECLLALFWLIVAQFAVLWLSMCADSCACGGGSRV